MINRQQHSLYNVVIILAIGNPRGNENAFLLTMGVFWFRVHNWWAYRLQQFYSSHSDRATRDRATNDEFIFNRARIFTIATYQVRSQCTICILIILFSFKLV